MRATLPVLLLTVLTVACTANPGPPQLETGITANSGGGERVVGKGVPAGNTTRVQ